MAKYDVTKASAKRIIAALASDGVGATPGSLYGRMGWNHWIHVLDAEDYDTNFAASVITKVLKLVPEICSPEVAIYIITATAENALRDLQDHRNHGQAIMTALRFYNDERPVFTPEEDI